MARVLINHGWTNQRPTEHWQNIAATTLRRAGHQVQYPQYPQTEMPVFEHWQHLLLAELQQQIDIGQAAGERIVIAHSLGCINILLAAKRGLITEPIDRLLLVAPAESSRLAALPDFQFDLSDSQLATSLHAAAKSVTLVGSDRDDWNPSGLQASFGNALQLEAVIIEGAGHLALGDGWGQWRGLIDWVNDPAANLTIR